MKTPIMRIVRKYEIAYPQPIKLKVGDLVTITKRETNPEWLGWVFCADKRGIGGWVSEKILNINGDQAQVLSEYDATELAVDNGEVVEVLREEFGWAWIRNLQQQEGWVPLKNLDSVYDSALTDALDKSLAYLNSDQALRDVERDTYWPKWDSPWWHMLLIHEMREAKRIPEPIVKGYISRLSRMPLKIFPIQPEDMPDSLDPYRDSPCHCQLGNVYQVLFASGVDVDEELPWIRPWLLRYQMSDGGMSCDNEAYLVKDEVPSSMVGTIAAFEAILLCTPRPWTTEEKVFLDKGARFLIERQLMHGSNTNYNASERESAKKWMKLCFPRFYLYDVLRGLNALLLWGEKTNQPIPREAYGEVVSSIEQRFPDGKIRNERHSFEGVGTILPSPHGEWIRKQPATFFPLLIETSKIGEVSPFLSMRWANAKASLKAQEIGTQQ